MGLGRTQVADALAQVCDLLPEEDRETCDFFIHEFTDDIIDLIVDLFLDPEEICVALGLCDAPPMTTFPPKKIK